MPTSDAGWTQNISGWLVCVAGNKGKCVLIFSGLNFTRIRVKIMDFFRCETIPNLKDIVSAGTIITYWDETPR